MQCLSTVNLGGKRTASEVDAALVRVQHFVDTHPSPLTGQAERNMNDMLARINNSALDDMWKTARQRYVHCTGLLRSK